MRYHIDTIPVWDAYRQGGECPLCSLREINEQAYLESFLGASVMEPDTRIEVNQKGFCQRHFSQMITMKNRLGLALVTHTHLKETLSRLHAPAPQKGGLFRKKEALPASDGTCVLCERLENTMNRYLFTVLHLWKTDGDFRKTLWHPPRDCACRIIVSFRPWPPQSWTQARHKEFLAMLEALQRENLERIEKELEWFTLKFDYRNADKPWDNSKDALERAINKLRGKCV